jgi:hypothetical protein
LAEVFEAVDAGGVAVVEIELDGVVADGGGGAGARAGFVELERVGGDGVEALAVLSFADGAGAIVAEVGEIVVALVAIGPGDVHSGSCGDVDFYVEGFCAGFR